MKIIIKIIALLIVCHQGNSLFAMVRKKQGEQRTVATQMYAEGAAAA